MPRAKPQPGTRAGLTFDDARTIALALDGVEEGTSYRTPAFKVGGKLLARLREDGETLVVPVDLAARDMLLRSNPETFYITDHYAAYPYVLVRLPRVERGMLAALIEEAWRSVAPKRSRATAAAKTATPVRARPGKRSGAAPAGPAGAIGRVRAICLALPECSEVEKHGRPCFAVRSKTFAMFMDNHHGDGRLAIWCKAPPGAQGTLVESDPSRFFVPPYVGPSGWVGVRLEGKADWGAVAACVEEGWRMAAPKRLLAGGAR
jgi:hypothetical protein